MRKMLLLFLCCAAARLPGFGQEAGSTQARCERLASLTLDGAKITSATLVAAASPIQGVTLSPALERATKAFCRVRITDRPSADSEVMTEVWLPAAGWNGRYRGQGNGGFAGNINYAAMAADVVRGSATSGTDTGHGTEGAGFALGHPEKVKDFGWRAVHDMAVQSKMVIAAFYGKAAEHSYFTGCSDGGREALMEAQRFPADYDGILAGAPAYNWTGLLSAGTTIEKTLHASASSYIPPSKLPAIGAAVRAACDANDGVRDGILNDPRDCRFDPASMACKAGDSDTCLLPDQVATLQTIYATKKDAAGAKIFPGYLPGAEDADGSWGGWVTGERAAMLYFGMGYFSNFVHGDKDWKLQRFDLDRDYKLANATTAQALNSTDTDLRPFAARKGRLILYHGWNDPGITALSTVDYYNGLVTKMRQKAVESGVRLYMAPGMLHCDGGPGANNFGQSFHGGAPIRGDSRHDVVTALEEWVESGRAPGSLTATKFVDDDPAKTVSMTRPLCVYPQRAKYVKGDTNDANSFVCEAAKP